MVVDSAVGPRIHAWTGSEVVCLCSNDYLSLAADPAIRGAASKAVDTWGVGAGASRLVSGTSRLHAELEEDLAAFKGTAAAIVTTTGWMANHAALAALVGKGDLVLCDKLDHASILDAATASGAGLRTFGHRDVHRLGKLLDRYRHRHRRCLIVTDSLFSMDGDLAPLGGDRRAEAPLRRPADDRRGPRHRRARRQRARGVAEMLGVEEHIDATVGTLSKAIGRLGGFVAGPAGADRHDRQHRPGVHLHHRLAAGHVRRRRARPCGSSRPSRSAARGCWSWPSDLRDRLHRRRVRHGRVLQPDHPHRDRPRRGGAAHQPTAPGGGLPRPGHPPADRPARRSRLRVSLCSAHKQGDLERFVGALTVAAST